MGLRCSCLDDIMFEMSKDIYGKVRCVKCGDRYKPSWGLKSERTSCREHNYKLINGRLFCIDCDTYHSYIRSRCCYHTYG